jgi:hypothetical protein
MIPEGRYRARASEGALAFTSKDNPQMAVCFELLDGEYIGMTITWYGFFSKTVGNAKDGKTPFQRMIDTLRICGWQGDDLSDLTGITDNEVQLVIRHSPNLDGELRAEVAFVNRIGGLAIQAPMSPESAKKFAAKMRGEVIAASKGASARPVAAAPDQPRQAASNSKSTHPHAPGSEFGSPGEGEDDIPF